MPKSWLQRSILNFHREEQQSVKGMFLYIIGEYCIVLKQELTTFLLFNHGQY